MKNIIAIIALAALGMSCSPIQIEKTKDAGRILAACLTNCGASAAVSAVTTWQTAGSVDAAAVGWAALPCVMSCAAKFGAFLVTDLPQAGYSDSVGATMVPAVRSLADTGAPELERICGADEKPACTIILRLTHDR